MDILPYFPPNVKDTAPSGQVGMSYFESFLCSRRVLLISHAALRNGVDKTRRLVLNRCMSKRLLISALLCLSFLASCSQTVRICEVSDLPVKSTVLPTMEWEVSPLRANAQYIFHGARSSKEMKNRVGDYYFLEWYDAEPQQPVRLVMYYTQALTGSVVQSRVVEYKEPRESSGYRKERFFFSGPERQKNGDVLSWRMELYCGDKLVDYRQSYMWD